MATLMSLSDEVIDHILSYNDISFEDIINFRCVCRKLRWAAKTEKHCFLKKKFFQRWSSAKKYYDELSEKMGQKQSEENKQNNEKLINFIETGIDYAKQLRNYVQKKVSVICNRIKTENVLRENLEQDLDKEYFSLYLYEEDSGEEDLNKSNFKDKNYVKILFFMDEIRHLLAQPAWVGCDLTKNNYYIKLFDFLSRLWRRVVLKRCSKEPCKELLEENATIWAQQLQLEKNISYLNVKASLKSIALEVLNFVKEKHPEHSIFSTFNDKFSHWENNNIDDNYWSETEGTQIMDTLEEYMSSKLKFRIICSKELEYECIDYVLENKYGNNIILYIIYESVARRLGLRCDVVRIRYNSFRHLSFFNILWIPRYTFGANYKGDICLLDEEHRKNMRYLQVHSSYPPWSNSMSDVPYKIYKKTAAEMLDLIAYIDEKDYGRSSFTNRNMIHYLKGALHCQTTRPKDLKFAVGMIVTHGNKSTDCSTGVIIGWRQCSTNLFLDVMHTISLIIPTKMCSVSYTDSQAHYIIFNKSGKLCCVREDDIALTKPIRIENRNIYHYFSKFEGTHYVPNEELAEIYPHDAIIAAGTIFKG